jgi:hypothetical protein
MVLNLMEGNARTWALPYLEDVSQALFTNAFLKRFAPLTRQSPRIMHSKL